MMFPHARRRRPADSTTDAESAARECVENIENLRQVGTFLRRLGKVHRRT